jgi:hypothetical protein
MVERSVTGPVFEQAVADLVERLLPYADEKARALIRECEGLMQEFRSWPGKPPDAEKRSETLHRLIDLNRKTLVYLSTKTKTFRG